MPYTVRVAYAAGDGTLEVLRDGGSVAFSVSEQIDPEMFSYLATPRWLDAINAGDGSIDEANKRVTITSLGKVWTARSEDQRDEVVALLSQFAQEIADNTGWTLVRARWFVRFLWRFVKAANVALRVLR